MADKNNKNILYCSFCGKSQHEVRKLIAGPTVFICDECVELCMDIIKEENKETLALKARLNKIYSKHTKKSEDEIKKALERDNFMTPTEAKSFGLIDQVVEKRS